MTRRLLLAALAGAAVMALELLSSRWLAPAFGFTLSTWAVLISVTLLAGSLGAGIGGLACGRDRPRAVGLALVLAGAWTAAAARGAPAWCDALVATDLLRGTVLAAFAVLFLPVLALATILPMLVGEPGRRDPGDPAPGPRGPGRRVGWLVMASTFGSLVGTLATALLLIPALGVAGTAIAWSLALVLAGLAVGLGDRRRIGLAALAVLLAAVAALRLQGPRVDALIVRETPYGLLTVRAHGAGYTLALNGIAQAGVSPLVTGRLSLIASRQYVELLPWMRPGGRRALNVGLGGGLVPAALDAYGITTVSLEVDPGVVDVLREHFHFAGDVRVGDARALWRRMDARFDFVILDAFQGEGLPAHLLTREAFQELERRLTPRGVLCVHLIGLPGHRVTRAVAATLGAVYGQVLGVRNGLADELQDVYLFASSLPLVVPPAAALTDAGWLGNEVFDPGVDGRVLTDDDTPLELWNEPLARALRRSSAAP